MGVRRRRVACSDHELLERWRGGEAAAGGELLARHYGAVHGFIAAGLRHTADADDLAQRTFAAAIARRAAIRQDFKSYLYGVARRQLSAEWARRRRAEAAKERCAAEAIDPVGGVVERLEQRRQLERLVAELPLEYGVVVRLFFWEELRLREIADELGLPVGTIKSRLHRGRALLRGALTGVVVAG